jgi:hypothetical protein
MLLVKLTKVLEGLELKVSEMLGPQEPVPQNLNGLASIITGPKKGCDSPNLESLYRKKSRESGTGIILQIILSDFQEFGTR